ncbi:GGDEF domain-containing protein [Schleiferilactobacillus harbinensis]|uniref:GGDEF domain-containing protein n=1 Tax=Schleiferilactobacillus harbinensis TaxID=304207 RepID=UPI002444BF2D|nr:GGDEF domain-containing protein [Schleiferilactobacillus harbinensis]
MINAWFQQPLITDIFVMLGVVLLNQLLLRGIMNFTINAGQKIDYSVGILNVVSVGYFAVLAIYFQYLGYDLQSDVALVNFRILILIYTMIYLGRRGSAVVVLADCASRAAFYGLTLNTYESWTTEVTVWLIMALIATIAKRIHLHLLTLVMVINCVGGGFWLLAYFLQLRRVAPLSGEAALGHFVSFIILNGLLAYVLRALDNENNHLSAITYEATYDPLTRLQNYGMFDKHYEELFKRYHLRNAPLSMIALDIDWFKSLNDQYGHLAGNQVLATIGRLLDKETAVYPAATCYRVGGEEFNILLPGWR